MEAVSYACIFLRHQFRCWLVVSKYHTTRCSSTNTVQTVYFIYPETRGVRLEDMNLLFGDATSAMPTPSARAETGSLMGRGSPVPSMDLRRGVGTTAVENGLGSSLAIPGLDIDPPNVDIRDGVPRYTADRGRGEGVGGWISRMVGGSSSRGDANSKYKPLEQDEE